jgi:hypothetical protein
MFEPKMMQVLKSWNAVGPLIGILIGIFLEISWQRKWWHLERVHINGGVAKWL